MVVTNFCFVANDETLSPDSILYKLISPLWEPQAINSPSGLNRAFQASTGVALIVFTSAP